MLALEAAAGVTGLGQLVLREPRLASGEGDLRPKLSELLMAGRNGDAVELFLSSTAVSDEFRIARADKFWPAMEASAPAFLYDLTISEELSADRYRPATLPTLVMDTARDTNDRLRDDALAVAGALPNARHQHHSRGRGWPYSQPLYSGRADQVLHLLIPAFPRQPGHVPRGIAVTVGRKLRELVTQRVDQP